MTNIIFVFIACYVVFKVAGKETIGLREEHGKRA